MTEAEWLGATDPTPMLEYFWFGAGNRKLRLFGCACCRRECHLMADQTANVAVTKGEGYADQQVSFDELSTAAFAIQEAAKEDIRGLTATGLRALAALSCAVPFLTLGDMPHTFLLHISPDRAAVERLILTQLAHCIFGNPFRPVTADPAWLTSTVVQLARGIYEERDFSPMPILADALQDAGCENADVLDHCRDANRPHARGCWVVDLVLGKV